MYGNIIPQTKYFPYNNGEAPAESFLEKEIRILAQQAERVYVLAFDAKPGSAVTTPFPLNVTAYSLGIRRQNKVRVCPDSRSAAVCAPEQRLYPYRLHFPSPQV